MLSETFPGAQPPASARLRGVVIPLFPPCASPGTLAARGCSVAQTRVPGTWLGPPWLQGARFWLAPRGVQDVDLDLGMALGPIRSQTHARSCATVGAPSSCWCFHKLC